MMHMRAGSTVGASQQFLHIVAVCVGCGLAHIGTSTMPFQIGALVDGAHRSASEAGLFGFVQVGALAAGMILISPWVDRIAPRRIAVGSCFLAAAANLGLYLIRPLSLQLVFAALAGLRRKRVLQRLADGAWRIRLHSLGDGFGSLFGRRLRRTRNMPETLDVGG